MIHVSALTSGKNTPSARYRIRQHISKLSSHGIIVKESIPIIEKYQPYTIKFEKWCRKLGLDADETWYRIKKLSRYSGYLAAKKSDIVWLERVLIPENLSLECRLKKPMVFDIDDAIWFGEGKNGIFGKIAEYADVVICGNSYLAENASQYNRNVQIIPTCVDTDKITPVSLKNYCNKNEFVIGWIGTSSNFPNLYEIETALNTFLRGKPNSILLISSKIPPQFRSIPEDKVKFVKWQPDHDETFIKEMSVGIMPLSDNEWNKGKCSYKLLQYMANGIPICASPVGMNKQVLEESEVGFSCTTDEEWIGSLNAFYNDQMGGFNKGINGRRVVENKYSLNTNTPKIAEIFKGLI